MSHILGQIGFFLKSSKPHHVTAGFLILILFSTSAHLYAEQDKISSTQNQKADKTTLAEMLQQNKELIDIQRQAQLVQYAQWQESLMRLNALESKMVTTDGDLHNQLFELKMQQDKTTELMKEQQETNKMILRVLGSIDRKTGRVE